MNLIKKLTSNLIFPLLFLTLAAGGCSTARPQFKEQFRNVFLYFGDRYVGIGVDTDGDGVEDTTGIYSVSAIENRTLYLQLKSVWDDTNKNGNMDKDDKIEQVK
jgi:hypothetical protein